jgi:hypothetical protein
MAWLRSAYSGVDNWVDSEDIVAAISLPALKKLMGESPTWKSAVMGLVNQIVARNLLKAGPVMNDVTLHSAKALVAGFLLPLEELVLHRQKMRSEGFFRNLSKGTVASLVASTIGPIIGGYMMMDKSG